jgi:HTH-type transcriptional regulator/antitoxin HipB
MSYHQQIMPLIDRLVKARKQKGLRQGQMSTMLGVPQSYLSSLEAGKHDVRLSNFIELARFLDFEVFLVPRQLAPAVKQLVQDFSGELQEDQRAFIPTGDD